MQSFANMATESPERMVANEAHWRWPSALGKNNLESAILYTAFRFAAIGDMIGFQYPKAIYLKLLNRTKKPEEVEDLRSYR